MSKATFLSAHWRHLALLNYEVKPEVLLPHLPCGTELDFLNGITYFSLVAFLFEKTSIFGFVPAFFHRNFEEVNLRFYVTRKEKNEVKRGVVFVKEIVPKPFLAWTANTFYNENYISMPMSSEIDIGSNYTYNWGNSSLNVETSGELIEAKNDSIERWVTEHYWGYTKINESKTYEYEVKHPVWNLFSVNDHKLNLNISSLYGPEFVEAFEAGPSSIFLADGSAVSVHFPRKIIC